MKFQPGDLFRLKSGGLDMTVEEVGERAMVGGEAVWCVWFEMVKGQRVVKRGDFAPVTLINAGSPGLGVVNLTRR